MTLENDETLARIVWAISPNEEKELDTNKIVLAYDKNSRRASRPPRLMFLRQLELFAVITGRPAAHRVPRRDIEEKGADDKTVRTGIAVNLLLEALPGREAIVVEQANEARDLGARVDRFVEEVIYAEIAHRQTLNQPVIADFRRFSAELESRIELRLAEIGLKATRVDIELPPVENPQDVITIDRPIETRCADYQAGNVNLQLGVTVTPAPAGQIERQLYFESPEALGIDLAAHLDRTFRIEVKINNLILERGGVTALLRARADDWLKQRGWLLKQFAATYEFGFKEPGRDEEHAFDVYCTARDRADPVRVEHKLRLHLLDPYLALTTQSGDAETEIIEFAREAIRNRLFEKPYVDILLAFDQPVDTADPARNDSFLAAARSEVQAFAKKLGYEVKQLWAVPDETANILQRAGVELSIPEDRRRFPDGQTFELSHPKIKGALLVDVSARLPDLRAIKEILGREPDLIKVMTRDCIKEITKVLLGTPTDKFHTKFMEVEQELQEAIETVLTKTYHLTGIHAVIRMGETALTQRLKNLAQGQHSTRALLTAINARGVGEPYTLLIRYAANGLLGTDAAYFLYESRAFDSPEKEVAAIDEIIQTEIKRFFSASSAEALRSRDFISKRTQDGLRAALQEKVADELGLSIGVGAVHREEGAYEESLLDLGGMAREHDKVRFQRKLASDMDGVEALKEEKKLLLEQRKNFLDAGEFMDPGLKELDSLIADIDRRMAPEGSEVARRTAESKASETAPASMEQVASEFFPEKPRNENKGPHEFRDGD